MIFLYSKSLKSGVCFILPTHLSFDEPLCLIVLNSHIWLLTTTLDTEALRACHSSVFRGPRACDKSRISRPAPELELESAPPQAISR